MTENAALIVPMTKNLFPFQVHFDADYKVEAQHLTT